MNNSAQTFGILAEYTSAHDVYEACKKVRDAGYSRWDSCTPFAVHGLDKAMGLKRSVLPWMVLVAGLSGGILSTLFIIWASQVDYPLNIGGKPFLSIPAFIPVIYECTILLASLTAVFGMFFLNRLPTLYHPLFNSERFARVTDDKFFIVIEKDDPKFEFEKTKKLLQDTGAVSLEVLEQ